LLADFEPCGHELQYFRQPPFIPHKEAARAGLGGSPMKLTYY
jgi:hypothetical protein